MNAYLKNGDVSHGIGLINSHILSQFNELSYFNDMDCYVGNFYISSDPLLMNNHTLSESKNHNSVDSTNRKYENFPTYLKLKILYYGMVLTLMLCYLHLHFINVPILNTTMISHTPLMNGKI